MPGDLEVDLLHHRVGLRVDRRDRPVAVAHVQQLRRRVVAQVVRVLSDLEALHQLEGRAVVDVDVLVGGVGDVESVALGEVVRALRLGQSRDALDQLPGEGVDDLHGVVAQAREDHALALQVEREVVEAPLHTRQGNLLHLAHGWRFPLLGLRGSCGGAKGEGAQDGYIFHGRGARWSRDRKGFQGTTSKTRSSAPRSLSFGTAT